jgi:branched-chain amino acid transport system ATP-binding protein
MVARGMNLVPEKRELFGEMSVEDNLVLGAFQRYRMGKRDHAQTLEEVYALFPRLKERRDQHAGTMSGGERQMLAVGRALMAKPKLLMLDEPSLGLAPLIVREIFRIIGELRRRGRVDPARRAERPRRAAGGRLRLRARDRPDRHAGPGARARGRSARDRGLPRLGGKHQAMLST